LKTARSLLLVGSNPTPSASTNTSADHVTALAAALAEAL